VAASYPSGDRGTGLFRWEVASPPIEEEDYRRDVFDSLGDGDIGKLMEEG